MRVQSNPKLQEAILYIANKCKDTPYFGTTKLYKLLFLADAESYKRHKRTLTGDGYVKRKHGPTPKRGLFEIQALEEAKALIVDRAEVSNARGSFEVAAPIPKREANTNVFTAEELAILDEAITRYGGMTAKRLSIKTHEMPAWRWTWLDTDMNLELLFSEVRVDLSPVTPQEAKMVQESHWQAVAAAFGA